jgi:hypothetical protein
MFDTPVRTAATQPTKAHHAPSQPASHHAPKSHATPSRATHAAAIDHPRQPVAIHDTKGASDLLRGTHGPTRRHRIDGPRPTYRRPLQRIDEPNGGARRVHARPATADHVPTEFKRIVQGAGGVIRGIAVGGSEGASGIARSFPFKVKGVPGAAIVSGGIAAYDTYREFQRSGFSRKTARTAAGGVGGVAGAWQGGAIGASIGAAGGPVGAVVGGAAGALIGGFVGSKIGQGTVDAIAGALPHIGHAAKAVTGAVGDAAGAVGDVVGDAADAVGDAADAVGDAADDVKDAVGGAIDKITPW